MAVTDIPVGGSTGHCHESTAAIDQAAEWLASQLSEVRPRPIVPALRRRFGLSIQEAIEALRQANCRRVA